MKTTDEYKTAIADAVAFKHENPDEKATTAARIHHVNPIMVRSNLQREQLPKVKHGGQNKILSDAQLDAIYKYVEDSFKWIWCNKSDGLCCYWMLKGKPDSCKGTSLLVLVLDLYEGTP